MLRPPARSGAQRLASHARCGTIISAGTAVACLLLLAGCGGPARGSDSRTYSAAGDSSAPAVSLELTIYPANYPVNKAPPTHYTLRCDPAGGTVPDPAAACALLAADTGMFGPRPAHKECPMIMMSSGHIAVSGTYHGRHVTESIGDGGCDLQRWNELQQIVG